jgi:hypothetical protein
MPAQGDFIRLEQFIAAVQFKNPVCLANHNQVRFCSRRKWCIRPAAPRPETCDDDTQQSQG